MDIELYNFAQGLHQQQLDWHETHGKRDVGALRAEMSSEPFQQRCTEHLKRYVVQRPKGNDLRGLKPVSFGKPETFPGENQLCRQPTERG
jgi:hypothetical protein